MTSTHTQSLLSHAQESRARIH